jgi:AAA family ATP:ADP antiporter
MSTSVGARLHPSPFVRLLNLFTEVRPGEAATALLLTGNIFLILTAYYLIKPVREALILTQPGGAELKSYASAGQAALLLVAVPAYGWLASRVPRMRLIDSVTLFFVGCLAVFYVLIRADVPLALVFFLWVGIFNLMVPAQFWAFANDVYTPEAGKRLFVLVAFGASSGAVFGSFLADQIIRRVGVYEMLLVGGALLLTTLVVSHLVDRRERAVRATDTPTVRPEQEAVEPGNPFVTVFRNRYLLLIAVMLLLNNWVNSNGEYLLGRIVTSGVSPGVEPAAFIASFYASYFGAVNLLGLVLQLFVVSRVIRYVGVRWAVCALPLICIGSYSLVLIAPVLGVVRWMKTAENATDYSLQSTLKQVLYLPTTRTEKYKAKQAIDTFFVRLGDVCSAALVFVGSVLALTVPQLAFATILLAAVWFAAAFFVGRRFHDMVPTDALEK